MSNLMKGLQLIGYGSPKQSLNYRENILKPKIKSPHDVLVRVMYAGVNPIEAKFAAGNMRMVSSMLTSLPCIIGADFSGVIEQVGDQVTEFNVGDEVYGSLQLAFSLDGTYAEYTVVNTKKASIAKKPSHLSFEEAAAAGIAVLTAYQGIVLSSKADNTRKRNILIVGASGGVGSFGVQIAKAIYPENYVVGICSKKNTELVHGLGADKVINYDNPDEYNSFINNAKGTFDIVFDCVGGDEYYKQLDPLLNKAGIYTTAVGPVQHIGSDYVGVIAGSKIAANIAYKKIFGAHAYNMIVTIPHNDFRSKIAPLFESKAIHSKVPEGNIIPLKEGYRAHEQLASHRTVGKLVLKVSDT
ncbi:chaperonin 10-like protein [Mycotypha africana]|uniref:chaperonin 10-like protein n=1 Tax=Mycotypha africana TaxID=64632 RepID=UPI002301CDE9|nr:chaperonin 10-like protein [Mycotypha africana]KAI8968552.1 chaperonin 10-like protein [Mycotypha africana]